MKQYEEVFRTFAGQIAAHYDLPEFVGAALDPHAEDQSMAVSLQIQPRGQMAAIVKRMEVHLILRFDDEKPGHNKSAAGLLRFSYEHHSGGSNGKDRAFLVAFEQDGFTDPTFRYIGYTPQDVYGAIWRATHPQS